MAPGAAESITLQKTRAEIAKINEEIRNRQIKNAQLERELIRFDDAMQAVKVVLTAVRLRLEALPDELQMEFPADNRSFWRDRLRARIQLALVELSELQL